MLSLRRQYKEEEEKKKQEGESEEKEQQGEEGEKQKTSKEKKKDQGFVEVGAEEVQTNDPGLKAPPGFKSST